MADFLENHENESFIDHLTIKYNSLENKKDIPDDTLKFLEMYEKKLTALHIFLGGSKDDALYIKVDKLKNLYGAADAVFQNFHERALKLVINEYKYKYNHTRPKNVDKIYFISHMKNNKYSEIPEYLNDISGDKHNDTRDDKHNDKHEKTGFLKRFENFVGKLFS